MPSLLFFLVPLALKGVKFESAKSAVLLRRNIFIYGLGGVLVPFLGIKLIDMLIHLLRII